VCASVSGRVGCVLSLVCGVVQLLFFFFFQAEDGIRDATVTGVQTCALPIYGSSTAVTRRRNSRLIAWMASSEICRARLKPRKSRSEERRVGKECRSRWAPEHYTKELRHRSERDGIQRSDRRIASYMCV